MSHKKVVRTLFRFLAGAGVPMVRAELGHPEARQNLAIMESVSF